MSDTLIIRPSSNVLVTNWQNQSGGAASYVNVDESSKSEADYNTTIIIDNPILYGFPDHSSESGVINKITLSAYLKGGASGDKCKLCIKVGSTVYYSSEINLTTSFALYTWEMTVNPGDSAAWEWADVDDFIGGVIGTSLDNKSSIYDCMTWADIEYTSGLSLSPTDTITLSDGRTVEFSKERSDAYSISDSIVKHIYVEFSDQVSLSDAISNCPKPVFADAVTLIDAGPIKVIGKNLTDAYALADAIGKHFSFSKADTMTLADAISKRPELTFAETVTLFDRDNLTRYISQIQFT